MPVWPACVVGDEARSLGGLPETVVRLMSWFFQAPTGTTQAGSGRFEGRPRKIAPDSRLSAFNDAVGKRVKPYKVGRPCVATY